MTVLLSGGRTDPCDLPGQRVRTASLPASGSVGGGVGPSGPQIGAQPYDVEALTAWNQGVWRARAEYALDPFALSRAMARITIHNLQQRGQITRNVATLMRREVRFW